MARRSYGWRTGERADPFTDCQPHISFDSWAVSLRVRHSPYILVCLSPSRLSSDESWWMYLTFQCSFTWTNRLSLCQPFLGSPLLPLAQVDILNCLVLRLGGQRVNVLCQWKKKKSLKTSGNSVILCVSMKKPKPAADMLFPRGVTQLFSCVLQRQRLKIPCSALWMMIAVLSVHQSINLSWPVHNKLNTFPRSSCLCLAIV